VAPTGNDRHNAGARGRDGAAFSEQPPPRAKRADQRARPQRRDQPGRRDAGERRQPTGRSAEQERYDGPDLPADISGRELDPAVRRALRGLPDKLADRVARHLVAAGRAFDEDPETAYQHTLAARSRAARLAVVREACAEAAYAAGHYAEALAEFRAVRRMTGAADYLPVIADCERALGRPERALQIARDPAVGTLDEAGQAEMQIVSAGARRDLGQPAAAAQALAGPARRARSRTPAATRLRYAYADALLASGETEAALEWFHRAAGSDTEGRTDAVARAAALEGLELSDTADQP
jgi:tetratricopeptide (TPR) repeat protein